MPTIAPIWVLVPMAVASMVSSLTPLAERAGKAAARSSPDNINPARAHLYDLLLVLLVCGIPFFLLSATAGNRTHLSFAFLSNRIIEGYCQNEQVSQICSGGWIDRELGRLERAFASSWSVAAGESVTVRIEPVLPPYRKWYFGIGFGRTAVLALVRGRCHAIKFYLSFLTVFGEWCDGQSALGQGSSPYPAIILI